MQYAQYYYFRLCFLLSGLTSKGVFVWAAVLKKSETELVAVMINGGNFQC